MRLSPRLVGMVACGIFGIWAAIRFSYWAEDYVKHTWRAGAFLGPVYALAAAWGSSTAVKLLRRYLSSETDFEQRFGATGWGLLMTVAMALMSGGRIALRNEDIPRMVESFLFNSSFDFLVILPMALWLGGNHFGPTFFRTMDKTLKK